MARGSSSWSVDFAVYLFRPHISLHTSSLHLIFCPDRYFISSTVDVLSLLVDSGRICGRHLIFAVESELSAFSSIAE